MTTRVPFSMMVNSPVDARNRGAVGNGVADDTAALQAALSTGLDVYLPLGTYNITAALVLAANNQRLFGAGQGSLLKQLAANLNVVEAINKTGVTVENLGIYCAGTKSAFSDGGGVLLNGCSTSVVREVFVSNHLGDGIQLRDTNDSIVEHCVLSDSTAVAGAYNTASGADIAVVYSSSRNRISGSVCKSGNATGIKVQAVATDDVCDDNVIDGNIVSGMEGYGIIAYRNEDAYPSTQSVRRTTISGNAVSDIRGTILTTVDNLPQFGSGIYVQGAEDTAITGNTIKTTHSVGYTTNTELLAPGAIGCTNVTRVTVTGNVIDDAYMYGIFVGDPNDFGEPVGHCVVSGNIITNCGRAGIDVRRRGAVSITGNTVDTCGTILGRSAIRVNVTATTPFENVIVDGNNVSNTTGNAGVEVLYVDGLVVSNNLVDASTTSGITANHSTAVKFAGNVIKAHTTRGIQIGSSCTGSVSVEGNIIVGTGSSSEGIRLDAAAAYSENLISGCTAAWAGAFAQWGTLTVNSATPAVTLGKKFIGANTAPTTITNFTGGYDGQEICVVFTSANTTLDFTSSSLKGNGGVDRAMASGDAIKAVYRAGASAWYVTVVDA